METPSLFSMKRDLSKPHGAGLTVKEIALIGMMIASLEAVKLALSFLTNIELVTLLIILYSLFWGWKVLYAAFAFVIVECMIWGFNIWVIMYLYIWPLLVVLTLLFQKQKSVWFWSIFSGLYGLFFGALCAIPYFFIGGWQTAFSWWIAGIPYDLVHCISNCILMFVLYLPLTRVFARMKKQF